MHIIDIPRIKKYIRRNIRQVHTLLDVAKYFHLCPETLRRVFKRSTGRSLAQFILDQKILAIKHKLISSEKRCFEIIYSVGFSREDSAARTFRNITGTTMEQYRRNHKRGMKK